jgi:hypothetical protein
MAGGVGLVLLWGFFLKGDFLAQKGAPKIGQKVAPQSPKPKGKLLSCHKSVTSELSSGISKLSK